MSRPCKFGTSQSVYYLRSLSKQKGLRSNFQGMVILAVSDDTTNKKLMGVLVFDAVEVCVLVEKLVFAISEAVINDNPTDKKSDAIKLDGVVMVTPFLKDKLRIEQ
jgi:hypothetical protein